MPRRHAFRAASHLDRRLRSSPSIVVVVPVPVPVSRVPVTLRHPPIAPPRWIDRSRDTEIREMRHPSIERAHARGDDDANERAKATTTRNDSERNFHRLVARARVESYAPHLTVGPGARLDRATASGGGRAHRARRDLRGGLLREHLLSVSRGRARAFVFHARRGASGCVDARAREVARERDRSIDRSIRSVSDETECAWRSINECRASD